jgi:hypothetical protein
VNCDDQVGFVNRDDDPHSNPSNDPRIPRLASRISIDMGWILDYRFDLGIRRPNASSPVLGMP